MYSFGATDAIVQVTTGGAMLQSPRVTIAAVGVNSAGSVVAIGASTGGPKAIATLLQGMDRTSPYGVVIVQHMAPEFILGFVEWLAESCSLPVVEAKTNEKLNPGTIYVAAGPKHLGLTADKRFLAIDGPPVHECCPSADVLFESIAKNCARDLMASTRRV